MPKPKRIRNLLKSLAGSSLEASTHPHSTPDIPVHTPLQSPQACSSAPVAPTLSQPLYAPVAPSQPTQPEAPSQSIHPEPPSSSSRRKVGRESNHYWLVDAIDEEGAMKKLKLKVKDVFNLTSGMRIIVEFDEYFSPIGEAGGLIAGVCGQLAIDTVAFPISFIKWSDMPDSFLDHCFNNALKPRFDFKVEDEIAKRYVNQSISKKWREFRCKLWNEFYDPTLSRDDIINNVPVGISIDQWATFVDYRLSESTKELCKRNQTNRRKQIIPHTGGAKSVARRRHDLKLETGKDIGRGTMWEVIHRRKDGSYVTDEAREIGEKIQDHMSQSLDTSSEISPNDAVGVVFGTEHPGRVRGLGMGVVPSIAFRHTSTRLGGMNLGPTSASTSSPDIHEKMANMESQIQALYAYINMKEGGIPEQLASFFPGPTQQPPDAGSGQTTPHELRRSSDGSNINQSADRTTP